MLGVLALTPHMVSAQITFDERETSSVSVMTEKDLEKNSTPNPYDTFYGLLPGLSTMQNANWKGNPSLYLRGKSSPLVVVDGYPRSLEYLSTVEIESVKLLKDGAATAIWGVRGANGVILVTTKRGKYESHEISVNYTHGMGFVTNRPEMANAYEYAAAYNEALSYDGLPLRYTKRELDAFRSGAYPELYANTDWQKEGLRNHTVNNQLDVVLRGGGKNLRYFTALTYKNDYGLLEPRYAENERYTNQFRKYELNLRMNIDVNLTPTTLVKWTMLGTLKENKHPYADVNNIFSLLYDTPSAAFPVRTSSGRWGGDLIFKENPIANISDCGYQKENPRTLQADMRIVQDLKSITKGLTAEVAVAYDNVAVFKENGNKSYSYEVNTPRWNVVTGELDKVGAVYGTDGALQVNCKGMEEQYVYTNVEGKLNYDRTWNKHTLNTSGIYRLEYYSQLGRNNTDKRLSFIGMAGYSFANRYMLDATITHAGTSRLQKGNHYKIYPSVSAAWLVSKESFMNKVEPIDFLKVRASWGQAGNDNIEYDLQEQNWTGGTGGYLFGENNSISQSGIMLGTPAISNLTLERVNKYNVGLDLSMFKKLQLSADFYLHQYRNQLINADNLYSSVIGLSVPKQNMGAYDCKGFELAVNWNDKIGKNFNYYVGANVSQVKTEVIENGEEYKPYAYMSAKGLPIGQLFGLEAIGFFRDEQDIANSPVQNFSAVRPGDIKYRDMNNDNVIDQNDVHAIGHAGWIPEWYGSISLGFEYKGFGMDLLFQGATKLSRWLNLSSVYRPLRNNTNVSKWYLEDKVRWTEQTKDIANMPRLSTLDNANNYQNSTQWLVDGSFLKLRNVNVYYDLPKKWISPLRMQSLRVYVRGNNLFSLDHVPYLNCENISTNYQDWASVYAGFNVKF